jgi:PAS domain S-box-containing protein
MDVRLKGQVDGVQASEAIRASREIPIIYLSAHSDAETLRRATATAPFGYLVKPFRAPDLRCAIEIALHNHQVEDRLRKRERWFATTLRSVADGVVTTDADHKVTFLNPVAEALTGWTLVEASGRELDQILHLVAESTGSALEKPVRPDQPGPPAAALEGEAMLVSRAGTAIPVEANAAPILDEGGADLGTITVVRDVSERRRAEDARRRHAEYLASLHETALAVMNHLDLEPLLETLLGRAAELVGAPYGFLHLETRDASALRCEVWLGSQPVDTVVGPNEGAVGTVWQSGRPLAIEDYDTWKGRLAQDPYGVFGSKVVVPLRLGGRVAGALGVARGRRAGRPFGDEDVHLLTGFAELASIALENARLFEQERAARSAAERLQAATRALSATIDLKAVFDLILSELEKVVPSDSASIQELRGDRLHIIGGRGRAASFIGHSFELSAGDGRSAEVLRREEPVIRDVPNDYGPLEIDVARGLHSWMGVRLQFGQRVIGLLVLNKSEPGFYSMEHASLAWAFAGQASTAIENARLYAAARQELAERKQAQDELQRSEERFRQLAENIDAVFWMRAVKSGEVLYLSPAFERVWGRSVEEPIRHPERFISWLHPDDRQRVGELMALTTGAPFELEYRIVRPDGKVRSIHSRGFPIPGPDGTVERQAGVSEDVTELKAAEALREDLRRTMVHDLRNPLTVIKGFLDLLETPGALPEGDQAMRRSAGRSADKLLRLIDSILDVSRLESGALPLNRQRVSLATLAADTVGLQSILANERELRVVNEVTDDLPPAWADPDLLGRILQNLIGNAIKFTPRGGLVRVGASVDASDGPCLRVSVVDNGSGIPPAFRGRLFEAFATGGQEGRGSGLGLTFCRLAVEAQGGRIWVEDGPGGGTEVHFTIPIAS